MRFNASSAAALLYFLSFLYFGPSSSVEFSTAPAKSRFHESQDGRHSSSNSDERIIDVLGFSTRKLSDNSDEDMGFNQVECELSEELQNKLRSADGSEWIIDNQALESLDNDLQTLIQCTNPGDRVAFKLSGLNKFKRTLVVVHDLEFVNKSPETEDNSSETRHGANFTCPDGGRSFLRIKSGEFNASGFVIQNCTDYSNDGAIVIESNTKVTLESTILNGNRNRAIYVASYANLTLKSCYLENNGNQSYAGGAVLAQSNVFLLINNSRFYRNVALNGGAIWGNDGIALTILFSNFSENYAQLLGGGILLLDNNDFTITNTFLSGNRATFDGAISMFDNNKLRITNTSLSGNRANKSGGAISMTDNNKLRITNTSLSGNRANTFGGAIFLANNNDFTITHTSLSGNRANESGGAILLLTNNRVTITNTSLSGNNASYGGALWLGGNNSLNAVNAKLLGNKAKRHGGALKLGLQSAIIVSHSSMQGNEARLGGAMYLERSTLAEISSSNFSSNNASNGGVIYANLNCVISMEQSKVMRNNANFGGCLYGMGLSANVSDSEFWNNSASRSGGCFHIELSTVYIEKCSMSRNEAKEEGGAIYATSGTLLQMNDTKVISNLAFAGGGIALASNSRIICIACTLESNIADRGGSVHIESQMKQIIVAQFKNSTFRNSSASRYGGRDNWHSTKEVNTFVVGGLVIKAFGSKGIDCKDVGEPCSRVLLIQTSFVGNKATLSGFAILATKLNHILVACEGLEDEDYYDYSRFLPIEDIRYLQDIASIKQFNKSSLICESWKDNQLVGGTRGRVVATFGQTINITTNPANGQQVSGSTKSGFSLHGVRSTRQFPRLTIRTIDAFGHFPAPTLFERGALVLESSSGILANSITLSFENATCVIKGISSNLPKGKYTIEINPKEEDVLEPTNLTVVINGCGINEELTSDDSPCQECRIGMYNFNGSIVSGCTPCPKGANCTGNYTLPIGGYWNKSPCHARVKRCIVEEACEVQDKLEKLNNITQDLDDCNLNNTLLSNYSKAQCQEGYEGPLCGSCEKSYGLSSSFECLKCGPIIMSILTLIAIVCYLLFGTFVTIKGVLPLTFHQRTNEDVETLVIEANTPTQEATSSIQPSGVIEANNDASQLETSQTSTSVSNEANQQQDAIEIAKQKIIEAWKILVNFVQVTSTAATMDVKWTDEVRGALKKLQLVGAATVNTISRPIDCLLSSTSHATRVVLRTLFSIFIPTTVIIILAMYWGYRSIMMHDGDVSYFSKRLLLTIITTLYITYFDLTQVVVKVFNCVVVHDNIDPISEVSTRTWIADTSIECYKGSHKTLIGIAVALLLLVSISFPLFCSLALYARKSEVYTINSWAHDTLSFLCGPFKEEYIYWECVTMIKKAILSIIIVFAYSLGNQAQGLLILIVLGFFLYLHLICYPYDEEFNSLNYYESGSLLTSCTTYTLVQFFNVETLSSFARKVVSVSLFVTNGAFVGIMLYKIARNIIRLLRVLLEAKNVEIGDNASWFSIVRLYYQNRKTPNSST